MAEKMRNMVAAMTQYHDTQGKIYTKSQRVWWEALTQGAGWKAQTLKCLVGGDTGMECWVGETDTERWVGDMDTEFLEDDMATEREWDEGEGSKLRNVTGVSTRDGPLVLPVLFVFYDKISKLSMD